MQCITNLIDYSMTDLKKDFGKRSKVLEIFESKQMEPVYLGEIVAC